MNIKNRISIQTIVLCSLFTALIAVGAFIKIPITYYVPITLQGFFITLAGFLLGSRRGTLAVSLYVVIGLIGFPIFTKGGGLIYLTYPSFGYLLGFIASAFITGFILEKKKPTYFWLLVSSLAGRLVIYIIALPYAYFILNYYTHKYIGDTAFISYFFLFFIPTDIIFCIISVIIAKRLIPITRKYL
jgi:biotin transport system substrate-specific component